MIARFRPAQRLHTPNDYSKVFSARKLLRGRCFDLLRGNFPQESVAGFKPVGVSSAENVIASGVISVSQPVGVARLGLIVPKKLARRAVLRNLIKRQAREVFRLMAVDLPAVDLVVRLARWPLDMKTLSSDKAALKQVMRQEIQFLLNEWIQQAVSRQARMGVV